MGWVSFGVVDGILDLYNPCMIPHTMGMMGGGWGGPR